MCASTVCVACWVAKLAHGLNPLSAAGQERVMRTEGDLLLRHPRPVAEASSWCVPELVGRGSVPAEFDVPASESPDLVN